MARIRLVVRPDGLPVLLPDPDGAGRALYRVTLLSAGCEGVPRLPGDARLQFVTDTPAPWMNYGTFTAEVGSAEPPP